VSLALFAGVETGVVVVADAISCGLSGRALGQLNRLHESIDVIPVLLTNWPKTGEQQAKRMFSMSYRVVSYNAYASNAESVFRDMRRPFIAVFRERQLVSVFGNTNIDVTMESLLGHLKSLGVSIGRNPPDVVGKVCVPGRARFDERSGEEICSGGVVAVSRVVSPPSLLYVSIDRRS